MDYENRQPPEEINYSKDEPLKELFILLAGATAVVVAGIFVLALAAGWLAQQIPFASERQWAAPFEAQLAARESGAKRSAAAVAAEQRLQSMADRIAQLQGFPAGMSLRVHLVEDDTVNAFATIGGNLLMTRGMLAELPHENALVTVLAHEAGHVLHRDPVMALGRGIAVMTALGVVTGFGDGGIAAGHLQGAGLLTTLSFNRDQERAADEEALRTLQAWYGYTAGAADLFGVLARVQAGHEPPAFLSTHPPTAERIARMQEAQTPGALLPLPAEIVEFVKSTGTDDETGHD